MAYVRDDSPKHVLTTSAEFSMVPVRHRKILDKLARCSYCGRLCCCIEHCLIHENKHAETGRNQKISCVSRTHEWIEASESALSSRVVKNEFPFFCVYCKIKVKDDKDLRLLMTHGPLCPIKKCHWMIPLTIYREDNKEGENKENPGSDGRGPCPSGRFIPKKTADKSLLRTALRNCLNLSIRTPPQGKYEENQSISCPLTSTPESHCSSSPHSVSVGSSPSPEQDRNSEIDQCVKDRTGILSTSSRGRIRQKGTPRRVTFACDPEITKCKLEYDIENSENTKMVHGNMKSDVKYQTKKVKDEDLKENISLHVNKKT